MKWLNTVDLKNPLNNHLLIWRTLGIISPKTAGYQRILYISYSIVINILITVFFPLSILIAMIKSEDFQKFCQLAFLGMASSGISIKFLNTIFIFQRSHVMSQSDERLIIRAKSKDEIECLKTSLTDGMIALKRILIFLSVGLVSLYVTALVLIMMPEPVLSIQAWFPFDLHKNPTYLKYVSLYQCIALGFQGIMFASSDTLALAYIQSFIGHANALSVRVQKIGSRPNETNAHDNLLELIECIKDHQHLIMLLKAIQDNTSLQIFLQFITTSVSQITFGYFIFSINFKSIEMFSYLGEIIAITLQTLLPCYYGEKLRTSCDNLANAVYNVNWYEQSPKFRKHLFLFLLRAQKDDCLMAGNHIPVTLRSFFEGLKIVYSFFTMLRNTM